MFRGNIFEFQTFLIKVILQNTLSNNWNWVIFERFGFLDTVDIILSPPPLGHFGSPKKGGGDLTWYRDLQKFFPKKGGGDLTWYHFYLDFWFFSEFGPKKCLLKKGGGDLVWYLDLQPKSAKKGGGDLVWYPRKSECRFLYSCLINHMDAFRKWLWGLLLLCRGAAAASFKRSFKIKAHGFAHLQFSNHCKRNAAIIVNKQELRCWQLGSASPFGKTCGSYCF